jgi:ribosome-binding protein aMBF1 (putative translation factor)
MSKSKKDTQPAPADHDGKGFFALAGEAFAVLGGEIVEGKDKVVEVAAAKITAAKKAIRKITHKKPVRAAKKATAKPVKKAVKKVAKKAKAAPKKAAKKIAKKASGRRR